MYDSYYVVLWTSVQKRCLTYLVHSFRTMSILANLLWSHLDYHHDIIAQSVFWQIENPKHPNWWLTAYWFYSLDTRVIIILAYLLAVHAVLYNTTFWRSYGS